MAIAVDATGMSILRAMRFITYRRGFLYVARLFLVGNAKALVFKDGPR